MLRNAIAIGLGIVSLLVSHGSALAVDPAVVKQAIETRNKAFENLSAEFELKRIFPPLEPGTPAERPMANGMIMRPISDQDNEVTHETFSRLENYRLWRTVVIKRGKDLADVPATPRSPETWRIAGRLTYEQLQIYRNQAPLGIIEWREGKQLPEDTSIELALGICGEARPIKFLLSDIVTPLTLVERADGDIEIEYTAPGGGKIHRWVLSSKINFAPLSYRTWGPNSPGSFMEMQCSDFEMVDGVMLPKTIVQRQVNGQKDPPREIERNEIHVSRYLIGDPKNTEQRYHAPWPKGAHVTDQRYGQSFVATEDPATTQPSRPKE